MTWRQQRGKRGEDIAARLLKHKQYAIRARNWRLGRHEIDLVCQHKALLVFVEVRTRKASSAVGGLASLTQRKRRALRRAILAYLQKHYAGHPPPWRCDCVAVDIDAKGNCEARHHPGIHLPGPKGTH